MSPVSMNRRIFGSNGPILRAEGDLQPGQETLAILGEIQGGRPFDALGGRLEFSGRAGATLRLLSGDVDLGPAAPRDADLRLAPLGRFAPPTGRRWSELRIDGGVDVSASGQSAGNVHLTASAEAAVGFAYRGVRAVPTTDDPEQAAKRLLKTSLLPFSRGLQSFRPNQWHEFSLDASLGLSAEVAAGNTLTLDSSDGPLKGLLPEDAPEVAAQIKVLAKAALGLELVDGLRVGCGCLPATRSGWVRYRVERRAHRKVSFGASLALELMYNRKILHRILAAALDRSGYSQIESQLQKIAEAIDPEDLSLENLKQRLGQELFDLAEEILPIDEVAGRVAERATGLLDLVRKIRTEYDELDGEFQGLVDQFLGSTALREGQELRRALEDLRDLAQRPTADLIDDLVSGKLHRLEPLLALLATRDLNHLLLAGTEAIDLEMRRLADGITKLLALIDRVDQSQLVDVLERATGSESLRQVLDLIHRVPQDVASFRDFLKDEANKKLVTWMEKLAGEVVEKISKRRLKRLKEWAQKVDDALTAATSIDDMLSAEIDKLSDRIGFVASFTLDRITRRTVIVDVELDPRSKACRDAFRSLARGNLEEFTERLPFEADPENDDEESAPCPFLFHHFVFTSDRSTQLTWIFAPLIGGGSTRTRKAFDASRIEIRQQQTVERTATYSGGLVLSTKGSKEGLLHSWMGSVWLESQATGNGPSLTAGYHDVRHRICLATQRYDDLDESTIANKTAGLDLMLRALGFDDNVVSSRVPAEATAIQVAAEIVLSPGATADPIARLCTPLRRTAAELHRSPVLDEAYLSAAREWLGESLIRSTWGALPRNVVLPTIVGSDLYRERWRAGQWREPFVFSNGALTLAVRAEPPLDGARLAPILRSLALARAWASKPLARLGRAWTAIHPPSGTPETGVKPEDLVELSRAFRRAVRVGTPKLAFWDSPLFQHRLLYRLLGVAPNDDGFQWTGVASVTWRLGEQTWQPTLRLVTRKPSGVPSEI